MASHWIMQEHSLLELNDIIEDRIGSLQEEVEIATNVKISPLYLIDQKDEIESLAWTTRTIKWILDRNDNGRHLLGVTKMREPQDTTKFEELRNEKIQELEINLVDSDVPREKIDRVNKNDTL